MACCCKAGGRSNKSSVSCLGRCDLPKHKCLDKREVKPGPVPKHMGWHYTAKDAPEHQLRCGWRPGHISCEVLRKIERHNCMKAGECAPCSSNCLRPPCPKPCCAPPPKCVAICGSSTTCCKQVPPYPQIRITRHAGQYTICTKPSNVSNAPSGPYPLKYVLNPDDPEEPISANATYSVEAKFNDYHFDYTSSQSSFVLDFSPPEQRCYKPCPKKSIICMTCSVENNWPCKKVEKRHGKRKKKSLRLTRKKRCPPNCIKPCCRAYPPSCTKINPCYDLLPCIDPCFKSCLSTCIEPCYKPCPSPCIVPCYKPKPCKKPCFKPCPSTCLKPCFKPYLCRKPCYKPCQVTCIKPCLKPYLCRKPCYKPYPCRKPCYKRYPCKRPCYKPHPCRKACYKLYSCRKPCYKPCPSICIKPCLLPTSESCFEPCPSTCIDSCCKLCSNENTLSCTVCSIKSICPAKGKKKKKMKKNM